MPHSRSDYPHTHAMTRHRRRNPWRVGCIFFILWIGCALLPTQETSNATGLLHWLQTQAISKAHARRRFRKARRYFALGNRYARKRRYRRAIGMYKRVMRVLKGKTSRDKRGRWEAAYRIAVIEQRRRRWRVARQQFEDLWRTTPTTDRAYKRRLRARFRELASRVSPELRLFISPKNAIVTLRQQGQTIPSRARRVLTNGLLLTYTVRPGMLLIKVTRVGFKTVRQTITVQPARIANLSVKMRKYQGLSLARSLYAKAQQQEGTRQYTTALATTKSGLQAITTELDSAAKTELLWQLRGLKWTLLISLGRSALARRELRIRWQRSPQHRSYMSQTACPIQRRFRLNPPLLPTGACDTASPSGGTSPTNGTPGIGTWVLWGVGVGSTIAGIAVYFGLAEPALANRDQKPPLPDRIRKEIHNDYASYFTATWVLFGVGIASTTAGTLLYVLYDRKKRPAPTAAAIPPGKKIHWRATFQ